MIPLLNSKTAPDTSSFLKPLSEFCEIEKIPILFFQIKNSLSLNRELGLPEQAQHHPFFPNSLFKVIVRFKHLAIYIYSPNFSKYIVVY